MQRNEQNLAYIANLKIEGAALGRLTAGGFGNKAFTMMIFYSRAAFDATVKDFTRF